ncbi:MAG: hypothetical protein QM795_02260 [Pseudoxanthomonas sp.]
MFAFAQDAASDARFADLRASMTAEEFKAAGLDKLSDAELTALSAWLTRKVGTETARAVEQARQEVRQETQTAVAQAQADTRKQVEQENRGFFDFGSDEAITSTLAGEFKGFAKGNRYTLANGQVWEQIEPASLNGVRKTNPEVTIKPGIFNTWFLRIKGYNTPAKVRRVK